MAPVSEATLLIQFDATNTTDESGVDLFHLKFYTLF